MDSMMDDDTTLPIDFDQTSNFARFLNQSRKDSLQSDVPENIPETKESKDQKKRRSLSANDQPERPHSRGATLREQENMVSDLKKECFGLKMRIYFMEEKLRETFDASTEDTLKQNIELKVTIEEIRQELREKTELLAKASQAMEQLTNEKENDIKSIAEKMASDNERLKKHYDEQLSERDQKLTDLESELDQLKAEKGSLDEKNKGTVIFEQLQNDIAEYQREIENLKKYFIKKDAEYKKLKESKEKDEESLKSMVKELEETISLKESNIEMLKKDIERLAGSPERSNIHYKKLYERQNEEISEKDKKNNELKMGLATKTNLAEELKEHISGMEKTLKVLRTNLHDKELDKQRIVGQLQEKIKFYERVFDEKNKELTNKSDSLNSMKENLLQLNQQKVQFHHESIKQKDEEIVNLGMKIKEQQYEIEELKAMMDEKDREIVFFGKKNLEAEDRYSNLRKSASSDMDRTKEQCDIKLEQKQNDLEKLQEKYCQLEEDLNKHMRYKDKVIHSLTSVIAGKDALIENLADFYKTDDNLGQECATAKDELIEKLQKGIRDKVKSVEKYNEEEFEEIKSKDEKITSLNRLLREKENHLQKSDARVSSFEQKIKILEDMNMKNTELSKRLKESMEKSLSAERDCEVKAATLIHKKDEDLMRLVALTNAKDKQMEDLQSCMSNLMRGMKQPAERQISISEKEQLMMRLKEKDKNLNEIKLVHENLIASTELQRQQLLSLLKEKEQIMKEDQDAACRRLKEKVSDAEQETKELNKMVVTLKETHDEKLHQFHNTISEKDKDIETLVKSGEEKDRVISDLRDRSHIRRSTSPTKADSEHAREKDSTGDIEDFKVKIQKCEEMIKALEEEKFDLQTEVDLLKVSKESLQSQLEGAYNRMSRQGTPDYKESLIEELEDLIRAAEKEKEKYQTLSEKLQNNLHPESCVKLLKNEIAEVEHLRRNLQNILLSALKKEPMHSQASDKLQAENKRLRTELEDSEKFVKSLQEQLAFSEKQLHPQLPAFQDVIIEAENQNKSLKEDLKRCDLEAKQLNTQLASVKLDYERLVHERDSEITHLTTRIEQLTQDNEQLVQKVEQLADDNSQLVKNIEQLTSDEIILTRQRDQLKEDVVSFNRQFEDLKQRMERDSYSQRKDDDLESLQKCKFDQQEIINRQGGVISQLSEENEDLREKVHQTEDDLKMLRVNLQKLKEIDIACLESKLTTTSANAQEEKKQMKKDIKELININERLRVKLKDLTSVNNALVEEKSKQDVMLQEKENRNRELEDGSLTQSKQLDELSVTNTELKNGNANLQNENTSLRTENANLQGKIDEFAKVTELQKTLTGPELQKLRGEVLQLTKENSRLKIEKLELENDKEENKELLNNLKELRHRNKNLQEELRIQNTNTRSLQKELSQQKETTRQMKNNQTSSDDTYLLKVQQDLKDLKKSKTALEKQLKDLSEKTYEMKKQLADSNEELESKNNHIHSLLAQVDQLELQLETFSPPHTSSQQNIVLSSDVMTQTVGRDDEYSKTNSEDNSLMSLHIKEMRELRTQLAETCRNNDALRRQLEDRLIQVERDAKKLHDPDLKVTLIRDNDTMRGKLAESEVTENKLKIHIDELLVEKKSDEETIDHLNEQLHELNEISCTLKLEMEAYDRLVRQFGIEKQKDKDLSQENDKMDKHLLLALLEEIRDLREQLTKSIEVNTALREKLEKELGRPVSVSPLVTPSKDASMSARRSLFSSVLQSVSVDGDKENNNKDNRTTDPIDKNDKKRVHFARSPFETPTKDYGSSLSISLSNSLENSSHDSGHMTQKESEECILVGKWNSYSLMKEKFPRLLSFLATIVKKMKEFNEEQTYPLPFTVTEMIEVYKMVKEINRHMDSFVTKRQQQNSLTEENIRLRKDVSHLKKVLASKEHFIKSALEMVEENVKNKEKDGSITRKLIKARDTLKTTKGNLQEKVKRAKESASSLDSSMISSSFENEND